MDLLSELEAEATVQLEIERVAGFEVGKAVFVVALEISISLPLDPSHLVPIFDVTTKEV